MALHTLRKVARALADPLPITQLAEVVCAQMTDGFSATAAVVYLIEGSGEATLVGAAGFSPAARARLAKLSLSAEVPLAASMRSGEPIWCEDYETMLRMFPSVGSSSFPVERLQAAIAVPFCIDGQVVGGMALSFATPRHLSELEREVTTTVGDLCAHAISRHRIEQRFRKMHDASPDGIGILRPIREPHGSIRDFTYIYVNPTVARALGATADALVGRPLLQVLPNLDKTHFWQAACRVAETGVAEVYEQPYDENGWNGWFRNVVVTLGDEIAVTYTDITAQKRAQASALFLAEAESILSSSLDYDVTLSSVARLAVPTMADWATVDMLTNAGTLTRLAVAHVDRSKIALGFEVTKRFPVDLNAPYGLAQVIRTGQAEFVPQITDELLSSTVEDPELLAIIRDLGLCSTICVPLKSRDEVVGAMSLFYAESGRHYDQHDLSVAKEVGRRASVAIENARLYRAVQEANRAKDEFLAVVSHELRTPLNAIVGWVHMLRQRELSPEQRSRALETVERNARAQKQLIEDLLDVSRAVSGKLTLDVQPVDLGHVIDRAIDTVRPSATARGIVIRASVDSALGLIDGDETRLQQVVWNLLSNAVKFSEEGAEVQVLLRRSESVAELSVTDHGKGIEPSFLPHVFERFRQAEPHTGRTKGGLGLGLAIVRTIIEMHGGTVSAESQGVGRGATFVVRLPLVALRKAPISRPPAVQLTSPEAPEAPSQLAGMHVLVVDDEKDARELLAALLESCKVRVTTASSGVEALATLARERPDIIVSDIGMPDGDGCQLIRNIRALPPQEGGRTPAIALTAYARAEERTQALVAGFNRHLPKPVEPGDLLEALASLAAIVPSRP